MSFAGPTTRVRATIVFAAASLSCSLFGAWLAQRYLGGEPLSRNAFACALAIGFHPLLNAAVMEVPLFFAGLRRRWFGAGSQP
ncbi:MAG TPA: hypothetical protein VNU71_13560 [Burkholderiaceae bacterium]|nr:hypothetical protein [Burkholderiaceae bacterium]